MYEYITKQKDAELLARDLMKVKQLPFDCETDCTRDGFDWRREKQVTYQFFNESTKKAFVVDLRQVKAVTFKNVLENPNSKKLIHNSAFDATWSAFEHGINIKNIGDTRLNENLILGMNFPRQPPKGWTKKQYDEMKPEWSSSLEFALARRGLDPKLSFEEHYWFEQWVLTKKDGQSMLKRDYERLEKQPALAGIYDVGDLDPWSEDMLAYDARDVEQLIELYDDQMQTLATYDMADLQELESRVAEITYMMSAYGGFYIDKGGYLGHAKEYEDLYFGAKEELDKLVPDINWNSPKQVCNLFNVATVAEARELDPKKLPSDVKRIWELWDQANTYMKMVTTYGRGWIDEHVGADGKVHCNYTQIVDTGRYSADRPNLQQVPVLLKRRNQIVRQVLYRKYFIPTPGKRKRKFVVADFKSQELAILAIASGEPVWLDALRNGKDLHGIVASMLFAGWDKLTDAEKKEKRRQAKDVNFGVAYGLGAFGLDEKLKIGQEACQEILNKFNSTFPRISQYLKDNGEFCIRTTQSFSMPPFNRLRNTPFESEDWRRKNIGKNNPIQSTAADMAKLAMVWAYEKLGTADDARMAHMNHDELVVECYASDAKLVQKILDDAMTRASETILGEALTTPDIHIVDNWYESKL